MKRALLLIVGILAACLIGGASVVTSMAATRIHRCESGSTVSPVAMVYAVRWQTAKSWPTPIGNPRMGITASASKTNGSTFPIVR